MINGSAINATCINEGVAASDAGVIDIARTDDGWEYTFGLPPNGGWDIYDGAGNLLETQYTDATYADDTGGDDAPPIEAVSPITGASASMFGQNVTAIQWQHYATPGIGWSGGVQTEGATLGYTVVGYVVERSADGVTWVRIGAIPADGSISHTFFAPTVEGDAQYRVYVAEEDYAGWRTTSLRLPCSVYQMFVPTPPRIEVTVSDGAIVFSEITDSADEYGWPNTLAGSDGESGSGGATSLPIPEGMS